jgi:hypothetical protein
VVTLFCILQLERSADKFSITIVENNNNISLIFQNVKLAWLKLIFFSMPIFRAIVHLRSASVTHWSIHALVYLRAGQFMRCISVCSTLKKPLTIPLNDSNPYNGIVKAL